MQRKAGTSYAAGQIDPELEGYNGKTWNRVGDNASLEGAASGGEWMGTSTAYGAGGPREATHNMGSTTTQTERGYSSRMISPSSTNGDITVTQSVPWQHGDLATGGQVEIATSGMDPQKLMLMGSMLGITKGPKGTTMGPNGTYGNGKFEWSDVMDWARAHPVLWGIGKTVGNMIVPGLPQIATAGLNVRDRIAARKHQQAQPVGT